MESLAAFLISLALAAGAGSAGRAQDVLRDLHHKSEVVLKAASLAQRRAGRNDVLSYARRLEMDHRYAAHRMLELAEDLDVRLLPPAPNTAEARREQELSKSLGELESLRRSEFDRSFLRLMRTVHLEAIDELSTSERGLPAGLVRALERLIPIYEQHVELAIHLSGTAEARAEAKR